MRDLLVVAVTTHIQGGAEIKQPKGGRDLNNPRKKKPTSRFFMRLSLLFRTSLFLRVSLSLSERLFLRLALFGNRLFHRVLKPPTSALQA